MAKKNNIPAPQATAPLVCKSHTKAVLGAVVITLLVVGGAAYGFTKIKQTPAPQSVASMVSLPEDTQKIAELETAAIQSQAKMRELRIINTLHQDMGAKFALADSKNQYVFYALYEDVSEFSIVKYDFHSQIDEAALGQYRNELLSGKLPPLTQIKLLGIDQGKLVFAGPVSIHEAHKPCDSLWLDYGQLYSLDTGTNSPVVNAPKQPHMLSDSIKKQELDQQSKCIQQVGVDNNVPRD